jgi:Domain of unknown function (DUF4130
VRGETCPERASFPAGELCPAPDRPSPVSFADTFSPWEKVDASAPPLLLPRSVRECITEAVPHRDPERYALLYALIWRVLRGERGLPEVASDPLVHRLNRMRRAVRRDIHKMHAFVRFRRTNESGAERFVACAGRCGAISRERRGTLRRLVRAGPLHPGSRRAVLRRALPSAGLVDPDSGRLGALGP